MPVHTDYMIMASKTGEHAHFDSNPDVPKFDLNQSEDSSDIESNASDETVKSDTPSVRTYASMLRTWPSSPDQWPAHSRHMSEEGPLYSTGASLPTTPLLTGPRKWSSKPNAFPSPTTQLPANRSVGYGTIADSSQQTAAQQTRFASGRDTEPESEIEAMAPRAVRRAQFLRVWLGRSPFPASIRARYEATGNDEEQARAASDESSSPSLRESIAKTYRMLEYHTTQLNARLRRSQIVHSTAAFGFMLLMTVAVLAMGYGMDKLADKLRRHGKDQDGSDLV